MMPECLIVSSAARAFAEEISRTADIAIPVKTSTSVEEAVDWYTGQPIVFGDPDMIAAVLAKLPDVKWVQSSWAGVKPLTDIVRRDYVLTGVKDVFGPQITEYVLGYLLAHELKVLERMSQQSKRKWFDVSSGGLQGKRMGIMGTGSIASHIAQTATVFGITVTGLSLSGAPAPGFGEVFPVSQLHDFLGELDFLVATLPQTDETENLLDRAALAKLPPHAYFINVGRGNVVNDDALVQALHSGALAGAALDVFDVEPIPQDSPLWNAPNLSITGHIAAISHPSLIVPIFIDNYRRYISNKPLKYIVDFNKGY